MSLNRTYLFAPGAHPRRMSKALGLDADAVILDLEDAVAISEKTKARRAVTEVLQEHGRCRAFVRVNAWDTDFCFRDVLEVMGPSLDGIILPKVEMPDQIRAIHWLMMQIEKEQGLEISQIELMPLLETGLGVARAREIARAGAETRVPRMIFGAADFCKDMGMSSTASEDELLMARAEIVLASRMAGLEPPIDTVWIQLQDSEGLVRSAERVRCQGFQGKLCIHPDQLAVVNAVFTPNKEEVSRARAIVMAFEEAEAAGNGAVNLDGVFVDYPIFEQARRTLTQWEKIQRGTARR